MSVRLATVDDMPQLLALGRVMHAEGPAFRGTVLAEEKVQHAFRLAIGRGLFLVHEKSDGALDGMLAGLVTEHWYSHDLVFSDLAFFVHPDSRESLAGGLAANKLLRAMIAWCREKGLEPEQITLGVSSGVKPLNTEKLLVHNGFKCNGGIYQLEAF